MPDRQRAAVDRSAPAALVREPAAATSRRPHHRPALKESELSRLWQKQQLPPEALVTDGGADVRVVYRGRRGAGAGPDFRDAVIAFGVLDHPAAAVEPSQQRDAGVRHGDIELHVRSSDFRRHGHHLDRAYLRLALHVVFEDDAGPTMLMDGRAVPTVALGRWVQRRAGELRLALADPADYREPCHTAVARIGSDAAAAVLHELGARRLQEHAARLLPDIQRLGAEHALYLSLARALGLTRNVTPMEQLTRTLPLAELRALADRSANPRLTVEGVLLGAAGLLGGQLSMWPKPGEEHAHAMLTAWHGAGKPAVPGIEWAAGPQRPGSEPAARLAGLAALAVQAGAPLDITLAGWRTLLGAGAGTLLKQLVCANAIGRDRAIELAANAVLPWLLAAYPEETAITDGVAAIYAALPGPAPYGSTRLLTTALIDAEGISLVRGTAALQGAIQMTRDWCSRGGCGRCPLS